MSPHLLHLRCRARSAGFAEVGATAAARSIGDRCAGRSRLTPLSDPAPRKNSVRRRSTRRVRRGSSGSLFDRVRVEPRLRAVDERVTIVAGGHGRAELLRVGGVGCRGRVAGRLAATDRAGRVGRRARAHRERRDRREHARDLLERLHRLPLSSFEAGGVNALLAAPIDDATVDYDGSSLMVGSSVMGGSVSWSTTPARWRPRWLAPSHAGEICPMPAVSVSATATTRTIVLERLHPITRSPPSSSLGRPLSGVRDGIGSFEQEYAADVGEALLPAGFQAGRARRAWVSA